MSARSGKPRERGATPMQPEERRSEPEPTPEQESTEGETGPETATPPIDEDVAGSVNAAVPDTDE
jgi:hypothetical protein